MSTRKEHWENVYSTKLANEVSWTQEFPKTSLDFIHNLFLPKTASIIDIGGGDSKLVDYLINEGYNNITVLDISQTAINRAKERLGDKANIVNWIVTDVTLFQPTKSYDCWHDRATFHFLTGSDEINFYLTTAKKAVNNYMIIGTFSKTGPNKCSMLDVHQYSEEELQLKLSEGFHKLKCVTDEHVTPFRTIQNFLFCSFKRKVAMDA